MTAILSTATTIDELRRLLEEAPSAVYAVLDACDEPSVPPRMEELGERAVSLYRGTADAEYSAIAPYLAALDRKLLNWILATVADKPWGFLMEAHVELHELRKHLRRFLTVEDPDGKQIYFRYYDPRVLPVFLHSCLPAEASTFYGPIKRFFVCDESGAWQALARNGAHPLPSRAARR